MKRGTIIIAGSLAQRSGQAGHTWVFLQYLLGFKRLGWDVLFLDSLDTTMCRDVRRKPCRVEDSENVAYLAEVMEQFGLGTWWSLSCGRVTLGVPRAAVLEKARQSPLLINVMGFLTDAEILALPERRAFLDIDPGFGQMWKELGLADVFAGHDAHITIGENIGQPDCAIPSCGFKWITTPQPVVLEQWAKAGEPTNRAFTTVASWRGPFGPIEYRGRTYGLRVHEFRKFATLPKIANQSFDLALEIDASDTKDLNMLRENDWNLIPPATIASTVDSYRTFIHQSMAELMIAKNLYVDTRGGWFSDRSICYLASGRPVLAQDTAWRFPRGVGLIGFTTLDEAVDGVHRITSDYAAHSRHARQIAEEYFASDVVLGTLMRKLGID